MILTLTAVSLNDRQLTPALSARFDDHGGTIGRADHNTLALPDPERFISRLQAEVVASGSSFLIRNVGSANAILIGTRSLAGGQSAVVRHGDEIRIGGYVLQADFPTQDLAAPEATRPSMAARAPLPAPAPALSPALTPAPAPAPYFPPATPAPATRPAAMAPLAPPSPRAPLPAQAISGLSDSNPFADLLGPAASTTADPFADLFSPAAPSPARSWAAATPPPAFQPAPAGIDERSAALPPSRPGGPSAQRLPDDFDPFAAPSVPREAAAAPVDPFADLMPAVPAVGIDQAFGLADGRQDDPLANFLSDLGGPPATPGRPSISTDPLLLFGAPPPAPPPAGPAQPDHVPAQHASYSPPRLERPAIAPANEAVRAPLPPSVPPPVPVSPPVPMAEPVPAPALAPPPMPRPRPLATAAPVAAPSPAFQPAPLAHVAQGQTSERETQALWAAFCAGAGVDVPLPPGAGPERMQAIGMMLRAAVDGTLKLMAVRASTKQELRADVTMIQQRNNNPLKFSPDAASGVEQLLQPPARGFLDGPAALEEAMHDLVGHSIGTVAGMRAAIEGMLGRFDPAALEAKLSGGSMLDSLLPMNRRARLWDLYLQHHGAIREEAQEDFHTLFGKAFLAAYEQQIERLRLEKQRR